MMKLDVKLTKDEINKYVSSGLKADGKALPEGVDFDIIIVDDAGNPVGGGVSAPDHPIGIGQVPSSAPIGKILEGVKITHYGYAGDSTPDTNSMKGIGDRGNKLIANFSVASTRSERKERFEIDSDQSTGKQFILKDPTTGHTIMLRDDDTAPEADRRVDIYDPYYREIDQGCTPEMLAKSTALMKEAGILV